MSKLIGKIVCTPATVRPGETVKVEVFGEAGLTLDGAGTQISINGVAGAVQYLQFPTVGQRRLLVQARSKAGEADRQTGTVDVAGKPLTFQSVRLTNDIAMIGVTQAPSQAYKALFTVGSLVDNRSPKVIKKVVKKAASVSPQPNRPPARNSFAARTMNRGVLSGLMTANPQVRIQTETQRLSNLSSRADSRIAPGKIKPRQVAKWTYITDVYDLSSFNVAAVVNNTITTPSLEFEWDFGDGNTATTRSPFVSHDYFPAINHQTGVGQFVVTCRIKHQNIVVKRTLTLHSAYTICKGMGTIVPHVTADLFAHKRYEMLTGIFTVYNVEKIPLVLDKLSITALSDDENALNLPNPYVKLNHPITIAPLSAFMISVNITFVKDKPTNGQLRYDVKSFSVLYAGKAGDMPVRCSVVFDVPVDEWTVSPKPPILSKRPPELERRRWPWELVEKAIKNRVNPGTIAIQPGQSVLDTQTGTLAVNLGSLQTPNAKARNEALNVMSAVYAPIEAMALKARQLDKPVSRNLSNTSTVNRSRQNSAFAVTPVSKPHELFGAGIHTLKGPPVAGPVAEGQICQPDNIPEEDADLADAGQLVCQLTDVVEDVLMPARWMNAHKGDIILSPGGTGLIGGLMLNVDPIQKYSHCGIMTRNFDEITHSTGSEERLLHHLIGLVKAGSDGFDPNILKYMWPGAVTQTVQASIEGELFVSPEFGIRYPISSFGPHTVGITHNDKFVIIPPLVVKPEPDPDQDMTAVRRALHAIADEARKGAIRSEPAGMKPKFHYRWYCYTDPTIGLGAPAGVDAGWAVGTRPSVCSSYIWMHAKARATHLETSQALVTPTDLEPTDIAKDREAAVRPTTPDGLYTYSKTERLAAARWLHNDLFNRAYDKAGWLGEFLTDSADDVANQFLNAFANDNADGKDSTAWEDVTDADAVSPDDILCWDSPKQGGLYGFALPALYREPRTESFTTSQWKKVLSRGTIRGKVLGEAGPVAGAKVQAYERKSSLPSANDGSYTLLDVGLGDYHLSASATIDGVELYGRTKVTLAGAELNVDIHLQPPSDRNRLAQIFVEFQGRDEESLSSDEIKDGDPQYFEIEVSPDKAVNSLPSAFTTYSWGGEVRVVYSITVWLLPDNTIEVQVKGMLYEGVSETTEDLDGEGIAIFSVGVNQTTGTTFTITNTDEDDGDAGTLAISVKNVRNNT
jgi:hypothetical protein